MKFTYEAYEKLIELLKLKNYHIATYDDYDKYKRVAILRHDVDNSLEKALELAQIEKNLGVRSTYFLLLSTDFYNIASKKSLDIIHRIIGMDHSIGIHFDEQKYSFINTNIKELICTEAKIMEQLTGQPIRSVSMHRPSRETLEADYKIDGIENSYGKVFFNDFKYVSDSRRNWREDVLEYVSNEKYERLHILTHPIWYNKDEKNIEDTIEMFVNSANYERYRSLKDNIRDVDSIMRIKNVMGIKKGAGDR